MCYNNYISLWINCITRIVYSCPLKQYEFGNEDTKYCYI